MKRKNKPRIANFIKKLGSKQFLGITATRWIIMAALLSLAPLAYQAAGPLPATMEVGDLMNIIIAIIAVFAFLMSFASLRINAYNRKADKEERDEIRKADKEERDEIRKADKEEREAAEKKRIEMWDAEMELRREELDAWRKSQEKSAQMLEKLLVELNRGNRVDR